LVAPPLRGPAVHLHVSAFVMTWFFAFVNENNASVTHPAKDFSETIAQGGSTKIKFLHLLKRFSNSSFSFSVCKIIK
jgi:hypothetical protein